MQVVLFQDRYKIISELKGLLAEWCLIFILLPYPIFAATSLILGISSTPLSMAYRAIYLGMALLIIAGEVLESAQKPKRYSAWLMLLPLFWLTYLGRMHYDLNILGFKEGFAALGFNYFFQYGILGSFIPALAIGLVAKKINYTRLFKNARLLALPVVLALIYVINHEIGLSPDLFLKRQYLHDDDAVILGPIIISQYGGLAALIFFYSICYRKITLLDSVFWLLGMALMVLGASRGPLIAVLVTHFFVIFYLLKIRFKSLKLWAAVSAVSIVAVAGFVRFIVPNLKNIMLFNRVKDSVETGGGLDARELQWGAAWKQFLDSPIFGDAIVEKTLNFYPHNIVLEVLMSTGLIGGIIVFLLLLKSFFNSFAVKSEYARFFFYVLVLYFLYANFSLSLVAIPQFWSVLALCVCLNIVLFSKNQISLIQE